MDAAADGDEDDVDWGGMWGAMGAAPPGGGNRGAPPPSAKPPNDHAVPSSSSRTGVTGAALDVACPHCSERGGKALLVDGMFVCGACNTVLERFIDHGAEWRCYGTEDGRAVQVMRCCPPSSSLLPVLGSVVRGAGGWGGQQHNSTAAVVARYHQWSALTHRQRSLFGVFDVLSVNASQYGIPAAILEEAKTLYKRTADANLARGENRHALIASSLYMACKSNHVPRSAREVAAMFNIDASAVTRGCKLFRRVVEQTADLRSSAPLDFVSRFCSRLGTDAAFERVCKHVIARADELAVGLDSTPPSLVAGVIAFVSALKGARIPGPDIAAACMVSQVTMRKCARRLELYKDQLSEGCEL